MRAVYIGLLVLVFLSACSPTEPAEEFDTIQTYACPDGTIVEDINECPEPVQEEQSQQEDEQEEVDFGSDEQATERVPAELTEMRQRSEEKTSSGYSFQYVHTKDGSSVDSLIDHSRVYVQDGKVLYRLVEETDVDDKPVTHILLEDDNATAYCVECRNGPEPFSVEDPGIRLALDWLAAIEDAEFLGAQSVDSRDAYRISGEAFGESVELYVDSFSGVPVRVDISENERISYRDIALGVKSTTFELE